MGRLNPRFKRVEMTLPTRIFMRNLCNGRGFSPSDCIAFTVAAAVVGESLKSLCPS